MSALNDALNELAVKVEKAIAPIKASNVQSSLEAMDSAIADAARAFSGSWIGYHSRVYYNGFEAPPAGAHFSKEDGLNPDSYGNETVGDWREYEYEDVYEMLKSVGDGPSIEDIIEIANEATTELTNLREELLSNLTAITEASADQYIAGLLDRVKGKKFVSVDNYVSLSRPQGQFMCDDSRAISGGMSTPPHVMLRCLVQSIKQRVSFGSDIAAIAKHAASHMTRRTSAKQLSNRPGTKVFIGHGRSNAWRDLKDFIHDRLELEYDEFNRVPIAGITNIARLSEMLGDAGIAFLVMTAEDEQKDGKMQARMNVVHEAGLFQGRLGFTKAIVVLEHGCEEFSNIQGLGQIRFPAGNIKAAFEDIRQVLEREEFLPSE